MNSLQHSTALFIMKDFFYFNAHSWKRHVNKYYSWFTAAGHRWRKINIKRERKSQRKILRKRGPFVVENYWNAKAFFLCFMLHRIINVGVLNCVILSFTARNLRPNMWTFLTNFLFLKSTISGNSWQPKNIFDDRKINCRPSINKVTP